MEEALHYPGFGHPANKLRKYIKAGDCFTIMLKDGGIVHYDTKHPDSFVEWLAIHHIEDIRQQERDSLNGNRY